MESDIRPILSIIVPVYNVETYLRQCLESLLCQTLTDIEIICVNDASPDNSLSILKEYAEKNPRVIVIDLPENRRQGGARNVGILRARAQFIGFVDSDDFVSTYMYEKLYKKAVAEKADIAVGDYYSYHSDTDNTEVCSISEDIVSLPIEERNRIMIMKAFPIWSSIYKKSLFIDNDVFFPEHLFYEDNATGPIINLLSQKIVKVNEPLYYYRVSNVSTTRQRNNYHMFDRLQTSDIQYDRMKKFGFYAQYPAEVDAIYTQLYYVNTILGSLTRFYPPPSRI